jgi:hypothetical protein
MDHISIIIPEGKWSIALNKKKLSNVCIGTCLLEHKEATPLKMDKLMW